MAHCVGDLIEAHRSPRVTLVPHFSESRLGGPPHLILEIWSASSARGGFQDSRVGSCSLLELKS